jgi:hypothetical protein
LIGVFEAIKRRDDMNLWILFMLDLGAIVCAIRAAFLWRSQAHTPGTPVIGVERNKAEWVKSEIGGWLIAGCLAALAALFVVPAIPA